MAKKKITYKQAGVDIDAGDALVDFIRKSNPAIGGFGGLVAIPRGYKEPRLVLSTDGVGTKLLVAEELAIYDTIGIDLVAMVVNDIITMGAKPIAFLDYFATERLQLGQASDLLQGIMSGCRIAGCDLVGGETAELPGVYPKGGFDLAGFGVGVVEKKDVIDGSEIKPGDVVIGLPSSGLHSNGYSLARRVLLDQKGAPRGRARRAILERMLVPTSIYCEPLLKLFRKHDVLGLAHITGGGLPGNLERVLPRGCQAVLYPDRWELPDIFQWIRDRGPVEDAEMYRVFNMGIGMCVVVNKKQADDVIKLLRRMMVPAVEIGHIRKGARTVVIDGVED